MAKKKELFNPLQELQGILQKDQWMLEEDDGTGDRIYSEIPVDIETFVTSKDWLGIAPQRHAEDPTITAPSPLSEPQMEFIEKATDFENGIVNYVLWVG